MLRNQSIPLCRPLNGKEKIIYLCVLCVSAVNAGFINLHSLNLTAQFKMFGGIDLSLPDKIMGDSGPDAEIQYCIVINIAILILLLLSFSSACSSDNLVNLLGEVETLDISREGYTLGKGLTDRQKEVALKHPVEAANPWTFKFKDGDLYVVADKATNRVVIIYERYEAATINKVRALVGSLYLDFGDPTVMAHDKIVYWVFSPEGKLTRDQYEKAKQADEKLNILATVKLNSSVKVVGDSARSGESTVYYIISSEPVLKLIKSKWK